VLYPLSYGGRARNWAVAHSSKVWSGIGAPSRTPRPSDFNASVQKLAAFHAIAGVLAQLPA
jgi:hypothetical protein